MLEVGQGHACVVCGATVGEGRADEWVCGESCMRDLQARIDANHKLELELDELTERAGVVSEAEQARRDLNRQIIDGSGLSLGANIGTMKDLTITGAGLADLACRVDGSVIYRFLVGTSISYLKSALRKSVEGERW